MLKLRLEKSIYKVNHKEIFLIPIFVQFSAKITKIVSIQARGQLQLNVAIRTSGRGFSLVELPVGQMPNQVGKIFIDICPKNIDIDIFMARVSDLKLASN